MGAWWGTLTLEPRKAHAIAHPATDTTQRDSSELQQTCNSAFRLTLERFPHTVQKPIRGTLPRSQGTPSRAFWV